MIIDIHAHIGVVKGKFNMPPEFQLEGMKKYNIDYALISNIACGYGNYELEGNIEAINTARENKDKLGVMLWCAPSETADIKAFEKLYNDNRDIIKGLKIHPDISGIRADSEAFYPYLSLAEKYSLPVLFHTQDTDFSKVRYVLNASEKFPDVKMILGHMSLASDNSEALEAVKNHKNIYADTAWVKSDIIERAKNLCAEDKIMFGTDSPIGGPDTYADPEYYPEYYKKTGTEAEKVMYTNAIRLFGLEFSCRNANSRLK